MPPAPSHTTPGASNASPLWPTRAEWQWLALMLGLGLLVRIALILALQTYEIPSKGNHFLFGAEYGRIARWLALGQGYATPYSTEQATPTTIGVPFFPAYLSLLFRLFGIYSARAALALLIANSVVSVLTTIPVFALGKGLFGPPVAWLAAALFCFGPTGLWYSVNCTWETPYSAAAMMLLPALFLWLDQGPTLARGMVAGLTVGLLAHVNATTMAVCGVLAACLLLRSQGRRLPVLRSLGAMAIVGAACIAPWSLRNSRVAGRPMLVRGGGEIVLYAGNHPGVVGGLPDLKATDPVYNADERRLYRQMGEGAFVSHCRQRAMDFIRSNPGTYARLVLKRAVVFWVVDFWRSREWNGSLRVRFSTLRLKQALYLLYSVMAPIGLVVALRRHWRVWPLVGQMFAYSLPYVLVYCGMGRYRVPLQGSLVLLGSVAVWSAWRSLKRRGWLPHRLVGLSAVLLTALLISHGQRAAAAELPPGRVVSLKGTDFAGGGANRYGSTFCPQSEINRIPLLTCADYAYNPWAYDPARRRLLKDLVEMNPGRLIHPPLAHPGLNTMRQHFHRILQEPHSRPLAQLLLKRLEDVIARLEQEFPDGFVEARKTLIGHHEAMRTAFENRWKPAEQDEVIGP